ncbi:GT2 family glycosyltransferase [Marinobacter nauticus]|uniref:GT2 family glycosyltransferase n=1 Tax=Marinobacter nauticus TaxID=2743 RepID=A0A368XUD7_MARNT|nr:hypothetical protein [Marinobacter nauticus]RCW71119.1 GT2 family glycosyltransferase [Marinobacter nauticus]
MKSLCFVVVNYFGAKTTYSMFSSVRAAARNHRYNFIVVDNSEDECEKFELESFFSDVDSVFLIYEENKGYFPGLNVGLAAINPSDYDFVVVGNNDLTVAEDFFDVLDRLVLPDRVFAVCPDVVTNDGVHQNPHVVTRYSWRQKLKLDLYYSVYWVSFVLNRISAPLLGSRLKKKKNKDCERKEIYMGIGAIYILTKSFFKEFDRLEYPFFLYGEEAFFSNQIHSKGGCLLYEPSLAVKHLDSVTLSKSPTRQKWIWSKESYTVHRDYL